MEYNDYREYLVEENIEQEEIRSQEEEESHARTIVSDSYVSFEDGVSESMD